MIVIAAVPYTDTKRPMAAPAVLKASLEKNGFSATAIDLNSEVVAKVTGHVLRDKILDFFYYQEIHNEAIEDISRIIEYCADRILMHNPSIIGLSLLTFTGQHFTAWLSATLKQKCPECKIVIGGPGVKPISTDLKESFAEKLVRLRLVNDYITGDGDQSFVEYARGNISYPGINADNWLPTANLNDLPYPDYSDYNFFWNEEVSIPIVDSRGCVRSCEFCDVIEFWKKFQYLSAGRIFDEMMHQIKKHNIHHFDFRSSISNGNLKEFRKLLELLVDYNKNKFRPEQISWEGSFIVRTPSQHPELLWEQFHKTHAKIFLGIESVVPRVRNSLGKNFSNEDIDFHLEMSRKHKVPVRLLLISGYPTETLEDYEFTKQWFRERKHYANNNVYSVQLSQALILPGTQLQKKSKDYGIINIEDNRFWMNKKLNITPEQRQQHFSELTAVCRTECNFIVDDI